METQEKYYQEKKANQDGNTTNGSTAQHESSTSDHEIDLVDLFKQVWSRKKTLLYTTLGGLVIGVFIAIVSPEEYSANIVLMPQTETSSGGSSNLLKQFGGLAGISVGDGGGNGMLGPYLYPDITESTPFYLQIIEEEMYFSTLDTTLSLREYFVNIQKDSPLQYIKTYTIGLPKILLRLPTTIINALKPPKTPLPATASDSLSKTDNAQAQKLDLSKHEPITLTGQQRSAINKLKGRIQTTIEENGTVKLAVNMPDPLVVANTTEVAVKYLTNYIQEYRTEKAQQNLIFIEKQYQQKEEKYNLAQKKLANFQDQNTNIATESARIELERLRTENNLAFSLYQSLAQQLEQAKIRVQEDKPVFKVLEPIQVPSGISTPNRELIISLSLFAGLFLGAAYIFLKVVFLNFKLMM